MNVALHPEDDEFRILSFFTGGGGLDLGVELAVPRARVVCHVERDAFCCAGLVSKMEAGVLAQAPVWSDARTFDGRRWRGRVHCITGGYPCQPFSAAGRRLGTQDPRHLWPVLRRHIVAARPPFVFLENVAGHISLGLDIVLGELHRLGFAVEVGLFTAEEVGAPHERKRVFILGAARWFPEAARELRNRIGQFEQAGRADLAIVGECVADPGEQGHEGGEWGGPFGQRDGAEAPRPIAKLRGAHVEHAALDGRREGRAEPGIRRGRNATAGDGGELADAGCSDSERRSGPSELSGPQATHEGETRQRQRGGDGPGTGRKGMGNTIGGGHAGQQKDEIGRAFERIASEGAGGCGHFPPVPGDAAAWAAVAAADHASLPALSRHDRFVLEVRKALAAENGHAGVRHWPDAERLVAQAARTLGAARIQEIAQSCVRGVADGMASRIDELRMLGNGVVPLEAGHAFRTLGHALAARLDAEAADGDVQVTEAAE